MKEVGIVMAELNLEVTKEMMTELESIAEGNLVDVQVVAKMALSAYIIRGKAGNHKLNLVGLFTGLAATFQQLASQFEQQTKKEEN